MLVEPIDIYNWQGQIEVQRRLLSESAMLQKNKETIEEFISYCTADPNIGEARIRKYLMALRKIGEFSDKDFYEVKEKDIVNIIARIKQYRQKNGKPYAENTVQDFLKVISKFWRWLYRDQYFGEAPPQIRALRLSRKKVKKEPDIYTKEEIKKIINSFTNPRDRAFFSVLYDTQSRVSEILKMRIHDISYDEEGDLQVKIDAHKTGKLHNEPLFESAPSMITWLSFHPLKDDPDAPLWTITKSDGIYQVKYATIKSIFNTVCKRENIRPGKRNYIHMFRKAKLLMT